MRGSFSCGFGVLTVEVDDVSVLVGWEAAVVTRDDGPLVAGTTQQTDVRRLKTKSQQQDGGYCVNKTALPTCYLFLAIPNKNDTTSCLTCRIQTLILTGDLPC